MLGRTVLRKDSNAHLEFSDTFKSSLHVSSPITSQRQHSQVTQALHSIMLLNFWVAVELIRCPLKPNPSGVCKYAETSGSTVQWSQHYVLITNPPPSRSPYEWCSSWPLLLLTRTCLHSCGHSSAIRTKVICASINQSVPLFSLMCLKYKAVYGTYVVAEED